MIIPPPPPQQEVRLRLSGELAVVTCYFNSCGYRRPRENYDRFAQEMAEHGVDLFTAELAYDDEPFALDESPRVRRFRSRDVMWHKERLLNLLIESLPAKYDKVAWIDADLLFDSPTWIAETCEALERFPVVQPFRECVYTDNDGSETFRKIGVVRGIELRHPGVRQFGAYHPGFAWAARRSLVTRHGLLDDNLAGGADSMMVCAMYDWRNHPQIGLYGPKMRTAYFRWADPFHRDVQGNVASVPGTITHLWHGERVNRKYVERAAWLREGDFDPRVHLRASDDGLYEWGGATETLQRRLRGYFAGRREDG